MTLRSLPIPRRLRERLHAVKTKLHRLRTGMNIAPDAGSAFVSAALPDGMRYELSIDPTQRDAYHEAVSAAALQDATWSFLIGWLRPDEVFFDLGANIGTISIPAALRCNRVHAFEMLAENIVHLRRALERNKIGNVAIVQAAVSDAPGLVGVIGSSAWGVVVAEAMLSVPTVLIDDYVRSRGIVRVDVMKIDIEGSEQRALAGAAGLIARDHPDIVLECNSVTCGNSGYSYRDLLRGIRDVGYTVYRIQADHLCPWPEDAVQELVYADYLATVKDTATIAARSGRNIAAMTDAETIAGILSAAQYDDAWRMHVLAVADRLPVAVLADERVRALLHEWAPLASHASMAALRDGTA